MSKTKKQNKAMIVEMTLTAVLAALIILMTFTGIGYIQITLGLKLTLMTLPVAIGSALLNVKSATILGGLFGLTSFFTCFGMDPFGVAFMGINPLLTFIMCFVPRVLCGLVPSLIHKWIGKENIYSTAIVSASTAIINTALFLSSMWLFFGKHITNIAREVCLDNSIVVDNFIALFMFMAGLNFLVEVAINVFLGTTLIKALSKVKSKFII